MNNYTSGVLLVVLFGFTLGLPAVAEAGPTCRIITYFATAQKDETVGTWSNCPGMKGLQGRRTRHFEVSTEELPQRKPPPGSLPCEFQKDCVTSLPTPAVVEGADDEDDPKKKPPKN